MGQKIGIDLGTTYSVVGIVGDYGRSENHFGKVSILVDDFNRRLHASAICECDGKLVFGEDAKGLAAEGYTPLRFWKRWMGKGQTFLLQGEEQRPQDLSQQLLEYLKAVAEKVLNDTVDGAVITHPAYFDGGAIAATREAGDGAKLNVGAKGLMMEPIAAAIAYLNDDPEPMKHIRVMVYDLGGGTFDITVLERSNGVFKPLSFDGDPELGGYNFDKMLAAHVLQHLRQQGYEITIDPDQPEKDARWACLLHLAEQAKHALSEPDPRGVKTDIAKARVFMDDKKRSVQLRITITRDQFEQMIASSIDHTLDCCEKALEKAHLKPEDIHRLILIGGSSRIPLVQRKLKEKYQKELDINEDMVDLAVALGAAIYAGRTSIEIPGFLIDPPPPPRTGAKKVPIAGKVAPTADAPDVAGCTVTVRRGDWEEMQVVDAQNSFLISVPLELECSNEIQLEAAAADGRVISQHIFQVEQCKEAGAGPLKPDIPTYLAKPLLVDTANKGLQLIVDEGPPLPIDVVIDDLYTAGEQNPEVRVELYQQDQHLVSIIMKDFPVAIPRGTQVKLTVHVNRDYKMSAKAEIPSVPGAVVERKDIPIPAPPVPRVDDLKAEAARLRSQVTQLLQGLPSGNERMELGAESDKILREVTEILTSPAPDAYRAQRLLRNLERLIREHSVASFEPSQEVMQEQFAKARGLLPKAEAKDPSIKEQKLGLTLDQLKAEADAAMQARDRTRWAQISKHVRGIGDTLERALEEKGPGGRELPPPPLLKMAIQAHLDDLRRQVAAQGLDSNPEVRKALELAQKELNAVNVNSPNAQMELIQVIQGPIARIAGLLEPGTPEPPGEGGLPDWIGGTK